MYTKMTNNSKKRDYGTGFFSFEDGAKSLKDSKKCLNQGSKRFFLKGLKSTLIKGLKSALISCLKVP